MLGWEEAATVVLLVELPFLGVNGAASVAEGAWMLHSYTLCLGCVW